MGTHVSCLDGGCHCVWSPDSLKSTQATGETISFARKISPTALNPVGTLFSIVISALNVDPVSSILRAYRGKHRHPSLLGTPKLSKSHPTHTFPPCLFTSKPRSYPPNTHRHPYPPTYIPRILFLHYVTFCLHTPHTYLPAQNQQ